MDVPEISTEQAKQLLEQGEAEFLDVRDPESYRAGHLPGARHLHDGNVREFVAAADKQRPVVVYCYHGNSSKGGTAFLLESGFREVHSMIGGFEAWREANHPVEAGAPAAAPTDGNGAGAAPGGEVPRIELTAAGKAKLEEYLGPEPPETRVRILVDGGVFGLSLDEVGPGDRTFEVEGLPFVAEGSVLPALHDLQVDYLEQGAESGFSLKGGQPARAGTGAVVRVETTPNPDARKFALRFSMGRQAQTWTRESQEGAPAAIVELLQLDAVESVFALHDFVTVTRKDGADWEPLVAEVRERLESLTPPAATDDAPTGFDAGSLEDGLAKFIRSDVAPFLQQDGGDIELVGYDGGSKTVHVKLVGACGTCPSSIATLRGGVERSLKERFPQEVQTLELVG